MKKATLALLITLTLSHSALCELLGQPPETIAQEFGQPIAEEADPYGSALIYEHDGWNITTRYQSGKSAELIYRHADGTPLSPEQTALLLNDVTAGKPATKLNSKAWVIGPNEIHTTPNTFIYRSIFAKLRTNAQ